MFDFYVAEGIEAVCFNVEESEGDHVSRCFADPGIEAKYYRFFREFWRLSATSPGKLTFVREIDHAVHQVIRPKDVPVGNQLVEPFALISMDWAGNISTFSPELLGLKNSESGDFLLGNINREALLDLPNRQNFTRMKRDIAAGVELCRSSCDYFSVCGGGEPVNKLAENGTFASSETRYCRLTRMRTTDLVLDALEELGAVGSNALTASSEHVPGPLMRMADMGLGDRMKPTYRQIVGLTVAAAMQVSLVGFALAQGAPPAGSAAASTPGYDATGAAPSAESDALSDATDATDLPVLYVTGVEIVRTAMDPKLDIVRVNGLVASQGWNAPQLVPTYAGKPADDILDLQFIATSPSRVPGRGRLRSGERRLPDRARSSVQGSAGPRVGERDRGQADAGQQAGDDRHL